MPESVGRQGVAERGVICGTIELSNFVCKRCRLVMAVSESWGVFGLERSLGLCLLFFGILRIFW